MLLRRDGVKSSCPDHISNLSPLLQLLYEYLFIDGSKMIDNIIVKIPAKWCFGNFIKINRLDRLKLETVT